MEMEKYLEGKIVFRPPFLENENFLTWKNQFESYVKSIDYELWHVISIGDIKSINTTFEKLNNLAKFIIYKAISNDEYERIFFCQLANDMWKSLSKYHQKECQAKETLANKLVAKESIVDKYLIEVTTSATSSNVLYVGNDAENNTSHDKDEQENYEEMSTKKELSNDEDDDSSSESEDEEYAKVVKEFKRLIKRRQRTQYKRKATRRKRVDDEDKKTKGECLVAQASNEICLGINLEPDEWVKDSGCSRHMTGNRKLFSTYKAYNGGNVIFCSDRRGKIIGKGTISQDSLTIENVEHVDKLTYNLLSVGQICDNKCRVTFTDKDCVIIKDDKVIGRGIRKGGVYVMKLGDKLEDRICLATLDENSTLWHRRLGHANMQQIQSLVSKELVRNLPSLKYNQHLCDACKIEKQAHASHKAKNIVSTTRCLELLHMDLFGPSAVRSYGGNRYTLVIVDDYSRYTWTRFLSDKTEAFKKFETFSKMIQNKLGCTIVSIRTDHGREFDNEIQFRKYCDLNGISHNFSAPQTPQSNGVVERKNRTLQEMSRTMLNEQSIPQKFWCHAVDTSTYILNRVSIRRILGKTPYELLRGRKPNIGFKVFGSKCFILNTKDYLTKFDPKSYEGIFLGYSQNSKAYIVLNKDTMRVEESLNVTFDETPPPPRTLPLEDDDVIEEDAIEVFRNKLDENGIVTRNKARLVAQGYNQQEGIDYDETYALVARLESIRILLAYACALDFRLYQMDVKSAFLNGFINEEVYVAQPPGFIDFAKPDYVYKLKKALYGLKQAPKAWYDRLKTFLVKHNYSMGMVDNTLFTKRSDHHIIIVQIYVDDIIFGSTCQEMCDEFAKIMHDEFEMSMMGELNFFLGLQIKQLEDGIFFNQYKYIKEMLKKFGLEDSKPLKKPMSTEIKLTRDEEGLWYPKGSGIETIVYADSDHAGDYVDRKSTSGICTFMGCCLTSWFSKKQTAIAISTTEAEYVSAGKACQQALWMKQALVDYDIRLENIPIMCDNKGAIDLSKNPVQHSRTKHIEIRHHFLRDNVQKGNITIEKAASEDNIADIFTKPLKRESFNHLHLGLGMMEQID
ncbi:retrotransposon protein [Artemisia annua]|uniref:Retrotransposon protein n=1 Tax=Artemisia annua TaxID=35608 RepID=A0A2U1MPN7_ARTAN|nr:retrotransposon protein [Artemisia annua]